MLPISDPTSPVKLPKSLHYTLHSLLVSIYQPRTWLLIVVFLQIFFLLIDRSLRVDTAHRRNFSSPASDRISNSSIASEHPDQCSLGRSTILVVYDLPRAFNVELLENCGELNPWGSSCDAVANGGFGPQATGISGIVPEGLAPAWHWTDQFVSEIIFHNRILKHRCRTTDPDSATAFYIPFYAGLAVGKYLWSNHTAKDRDGHCEAAMRWVQDQPYYQRSDGRDHFITMGRVTWDFRRTRDRDWGSRCIHLPGMRNVTRLLIERDTWDHHDVGVPYPTSFHPRTGSDVARWQDHVRRRVRRTLFCFAGATRRSVRNDFREILLRQCRGEPGSCREVDCSWRRCSGGAPAVLEAFLDSDFCLQPRGDSFTRRSVFDCMVAGSIPVFFWNRTAYSQYEWFLPAEPGSYSVFIDRREVEQGRSIKGVLEKYSRAEVEKMREKVIECMARLVYSKAEEGLEGVKDAFDVAIDGVFRRFKEQEQKGFKW